MIELADGDAYLNFKEWCQLSGVQPRRYGHDVRHNLTPLELPDLYLNGDELCPLFRRSRAASFLEKYNEYKQYKMWHGRYTRMMEHKQRKKAEAEHAN